MAGLGGTNWIEVGSILTGVGASVTAGLALVTRDIANKTSAVAKRTEALADQTKILADETRRLAAAGEDDVRMSQLALQSTIRPLLVGVPLGLPQHAVAETIRYRDGSEVREVQLAERGQIDVAVTGSKVQLSAPFRNVGSGVALVLGAWARTADNQGRVSGGPSLAGVVGPGEITRMILFTGLYQPVVDAIQQGETLYFGVQYTDADGHQQTLSETEVRQGPDGAWIPGRTLLFHWDGSYPDKPFASGGW